MKYFQIFFLLLTTLKATDIKLEHYKNRREIILQPIDDLEIMFYLIEEAKIELWVFLVCNHSPKKITNISKRFAFKRNRLEKVKRFQVCDDLYIDLGLSIKKTETHFDVCIGTFTFLKHSEIIIRNYFNERIGLNSIYFGKKLDKLKNNWINNSQMNIFRALPHQKSKIAREICCCNIF